MPYHDVLLCELGVQDGKAQCMENWSLVGAIAINGAVDAGARMPPRNVGRIPYPSLHGSACLFQNVS